MAKWEKVKLGDVLEVQKKSKIKAGSGLKFGMYPFFTSSSSLSKYVNEAEYYKPAIIFGTGGMANIHFCETPFSVSTDCLVFYAKGSNVNVNLNYIYKFFIGHMYKLEEGFKGAGLKHISKTFLENIIIPLPPLEEQKKIAERLDAVSDLLEKQKQLLAEQDNLIKSIFYDMFGDLQINERKWPVKVLKDIAAVKIGPFGTLLHKEDYIYNGYPLINPTHIKAGKIQPDIKLSITQEKYDELKDYHLQKGDIVLGRRGKMGRCAVVDIENVICGTGSLIIRPNSLMMPYILQSILSSSTYRKIFEDKAVGVTMKNLSAKIVENIQIPIVPLHLQQKFSYVLERVEAQKEKIKSSIAETQTLFASLMAKYFDEE